MVPDVSTGSYTRGLLGYLYRTGRFENHTDPHIVAAWDMAGASDPGRDPDATLAALARRLDAHVRLRARERGGTLPPKHVWHRPVRTAPGDRHLTDAEWAEVARRIVTATGIAPDGDDEACRWIAVRHAEDHIHIVATTVRADGRRPRTHGDGRRAQAACRQIEKDFGLRRLKPGDISAPKTPTSAEQAKDTRQGRTTTAREWLREQAYRVLATSRTEDEFFSTLETLGIKVNKRIGPNTGDVIGYSLAAPDDTNTHGEAVFYGGSKLAPDLSINRIRERLTAHRAGTAAPSQHPIREAETVLRDTLTVLHAADDATAQAHLAAFGELLHTTTLAATGPTRIEIATAARVFNRATSSAIRAHHQNAARLRTAAKDLLYEIGSGKDGAAFAALLSTAILVAIAAANWHSNRRHQQQAAAAHQALVTLQSAYDRASQPYVTDLTARTPHAHAIHRYEDAVRSSLPDHADRILADPAWPALAATLAHAPGHSLYSLLGVAAGQRELGTAHSPAQVLIWRVNRSVNLRGVTTRSSAMVSIPSERRGAGKMESPAWRALRSGAPRRVR